MKPFFILCVDDEREVLDSVAEDLKMFEGKFDIEVAESVQESREVILEAMTRGQNLALIFCDHVMPNETGVDFLIELDNDPKTAASKKILLTGQAGLNDTIEAINNAHLDFFLKKPWTKEEIEDIAKNQLTDFILESSDQPIQYTDILNSERIFSEIHKKGSL